MIPFCGRRTKRYEAHIWDERQQRYLGGFDKVAISSSYGLIGISMLLSCPVHSHFVDAFQMLCKEVV